MLSFVYIYALYDMFYRTVMCIPYLGLYNVQDFAQIL